MATYDDTRILVVDDSRSDQLLLEAQLAPRGYLLEFANDGVEALNLLERNPLRYDVVLLDRAMPRMGGIEVLNTIKQQPLLRTLPVIMQTASSTREEVLEGIRAGAYYYLTKPYDGETLAAMVETAARDFAEFRALQERVARGLECLTLMQSAAVSIQTIDQARNIAAVFANACPNPSVAVIGLTELLVNAVEHGNLGITYQDKSELNASGTWDAEVRRRLELDENKAKRAVLKMERDVETIRFTIVDEGSGFTWGNYLAVDPARAFDNHGRGIAISRAMSFDSIEYRGSGNVVVAVVRSPNTPAVDPSE